MFAPSGFHHLAGERLKVVELAGFDCQLDAPRNLIAHLIDYTVAAGLLPRTRHVALCYSTTANALLLDRPTLSLS